MPGEPDRLGKRDTWKVERAIVLQVLRDDHVERWSPGELAGQILDFEPVVIARALTRLELEGLVSREGPSVCASRATRYLDALELVGI
jgi:hypothetical protein